MKLSRPVVVRNLGWVGLKELTSSRQEGIFWSDGNVLYFNCDHFMDLGSFQNASCKFQRSTFYLWKIYIIKTDFFFKFMMHLKQCLEETFFTFKWICTKMKDLKLLIHISILRYKMMITLNPRYIEESKW